MVEPASRAPTPAVSHVSPLIEHSNGTLYPYWNLHKGGITPYLDAVRRAFASVNPFSHQQVPTTERMGLNIKFGQKYYREEPFPNSTHFDALYPSHYNPLNDQRFTQKPNNVRHVTEQLSIVSRAIVPRFCARQINKYQTCVVANDVNSCKQEEDDIIAICPGWALHNLKEKKLSQIKEEALLNQRYRSAIEVSEYNRGRTVADVPLRRWEDGNRDVLRPNTMYADDRYVDITAEEVEAAKQRVKARRLAHPAENKADLPKYDRTYQVPPRGTPLHVL